MTPQRIVFGAHGFKWRVGPGVVGDHRPAQCISELATEHRRWLAAQQRRGLCLLIGGLGHMLKGVDLTALGIAPQPRCKRRFDMPPNAPSCCIKSPPNPPMQQCCNTAHVSGRQRASLSDNRAKGKSPQTPGEPGIRGALSSLWAVKDSNLQPWD
jgi:hypothetical protein